MSVEFYADPLGVASDIPFRLPPHVCTAETAEGELGWALFRFTDSEYQAFGAACAERSRRAYESYQKSLELAKAGKIREIVSPPNPARDWLDAVVGPFQWRYKGREGVETFEPRDLPADLLAVVVQDSAAFYRGEVWRPPVEAPKSEAETWPAATDPDPTPPSES